MTENQIRQQLVDMALYYMGIKEGSTAHKGIVAIFNSFEPHPRGHVLTVTEPWCAGFQSAMAIDRKGEDVLDTDGTAADIIDSQN